MLEFEYDDAQTFSVLSLLYPNLDYRNKFHKDHIFPQKFFSNRELNKRSIPREDWDTYIESQDYIGNLQLLEGIQNEEKSAQEFDKWILLNYPEEAARNKYKLSNYIPSNIDLQFPNYLNFIDKRQELIRSKLMELFGVQK